MKDRADIALFSQSGDDPEDGRASWLSRRLGAVLAPVLTPGQPVPQQACSEAKDDGQDEDHAQQELDAGRRRLGGHSGLSVDPGDDDTVPAQFVDEYGRGAPGDLLSLYRAPALGHDVDDGSAGQ